MLAGLVIAASRTTVPPTPLEPPRGAAIPDDIVILAAHRAPHATPDCGAAIWSHHPLDDTRPGPYCVAWLTLPEHDPILVVGRVGEPPTALIPPVYRFTAADGAITARGEPPDERLLAAVADALAGWTAP